MSYCLAIKLVILNEVLWLIHLAVWYLRIESQLLLDGQTETYFFISCSKMARGN